jgi:hypothetical protein
MPLKACNGLEVPTVRGAIVMVVCTDSEYPPMHKQAPIKVNAFCDEDIADGSFKMAASFLRSYHVCGIRLRH